MDLRNGFDIKRYIRTIPDYPKAGIQFRDITTLLADLHGFRAAVDELSWPFLKGNIDYVAGIEARGFILGGAVAHVLGRGFVPIRKKGSSPERWSARITPLNMASIVSRSMPMPFTATTGCC